MSSVRVVIVSDRELFVEGLSRILSHEPGLMLAGREAGEKLLTESAADILLVDHQMREAGSLMLRNGRRPWAIALAVENNPDAALRALESGARGVLTKSDGVADLLRAIAVVHQGQIWARKEVVTRVVERMASIGSSASEAPEAHHNPLSGREQEIMERAARGLTNKEIADELRISQATVKTHLSRVFQKLRVRDRAGLAAAYPHPPSGNGG